MGVCNISDISQENISELFKGFEIVHAYIYDVLVIPKNDIRYHLKDLEKFYRDSRKWY